MKVFDELVSNTFSLPFNSSSWTIPTAPFKSSRDLRPENFTLLPTAVSIVRKKKVQMRTAMLRVRMLLHPTVWSMCINDMINYGSSFFIWVFNTQRRTSSVISATTQYPSQGNTHVIIIEDVPKYVGLNLVFGTSGCFVTDGQTDRQTDGQTDRRIKGVLGLL